MNKTTTRLYDLVSKNNGIVTFAEPMPVDFKLHITYSEKDITEEDCKGVVKEVSLSTLGEEKLLTFIIDNGNYEMYLDYSTNYNYLMLCYSYEDSDGDFEVNTTVDEKNIPLAVIKQLIKKIEYGEFDKFYTPAYEFLNNCELKDDSVSKGEAIINSYIAGMKKAYEMLGVEFK